MTKTDGSNHPGFAFAKTTRPKKDTKGRAQHIAQIRAAVVTRDGARCRRCHRGMADGIWRLEMHEIESRRHLMGKPYWEIFTMENCLMLCGPPTDSTTCHGMVTLNRVTITPDSASGAEGPVTFTTRTT